MLNIEERHVRTREPLHERQPQNLAQVPCVRKGRIGGESGAGDPRNPASCLQD
jgi:hypothetical protein